MKEIENQVGVSISKSTLRNIYRENAVSYLRVSPKYYRKSSDEEYLEETHLFVRALCRSIHAKIPVIFYDQTSVHW